MSCSLENRAVALKKVLATSSLSWINKSDGYYVEQQRNRVLGG